MSKINDILTRWFGGSNRVDLSAISGYSFADVERMNFAELLWLNVCDLLVDITTDVNWRFVSGSGDMFYSFKACYQRDARIALHDMLSRGFCVFGVLGNLVRVLRPDEFRVNSDGGALQVVPNDSRVRVIVLASDTKRISGMSDKQLCRGHLRFYDNVLNASNTVSERLGSVVIATPVNAPQIPKAPILDVEQKRALEEQLQADYGALRRQRNIMLLPREMNFQTLNMAGIDQRTAEKARLAVLAICDRLKVPANQVAMIDANSSRSLSNGGELREGDMMKYKSFRRLLNSSWWLLADYLGIVVDYEIENEPRYNEESTNQ